MIVVGKMMKWNPVRQIDSARVFSLLLAAGRRAQAVHLNRVVERGARRQEPVDRAARRDPETL